MFLICPSLSWAQTVPSVNATVEYTEPDKQSCTPSPCVGKQLNQLDHTTIYFEVRDVGGVVLDQWTKTKPATSPQGGGSVTHKFTRAVSEEATSLHMWASASNPIGEGLKSVALIKTLPLLDLQVPSGTQNLKVTITIKAVIK